MSTLGDDLDKLALLARREKILAKRLDEAKKRRKAHELDVYDRMVDEGWEPGKSTLNRNGVKFRPSSTTYAQVQDEAALAEWLAEQEGDDFDYAGITEPKFRKALLNQLVRELEDNGEDLPPGLGSYDKNSVQKSGIMGHDDDEGEDTDDGE